MEQMINKVMAAMHDLDPEQLRRLENVLVFLFVILIICIVCKHLDNWVDSYCDAIIGKDKDTQKEN